MTVAELIAALQELPPTAQVILQKDAEGNHYSPLDCVDGNAIYVAYNIYSGEVYDTDLDCNEHCLTHDEWQELLKQPRCVVLSPIN